MHSSPARIFFFNDTATTEIYTLSLHDALPICNVLGHIAIGEPAPIQDPGALPGIGSAQRIHKGLRSQEHTSELQSHLNFVCLLLLENKTLQPTSQQPRNTTCSRHVLETHTTRL